MEQFKVENGIRLFLHAKHFSKVYPAKGYEVYKLGKLMLGVDFVLYMYHLWTYVHHDRRPGQVTPVKVDGVFSDAHDLIDQVTPFLRHA